MGGAGFIGRWLGPALAGRGYEVVTVDLNEPDDAPGEWIKADARDADAMEKIIRPGDAVVHLVHSSTPAETAHDPVSEFKHNVIPYAQLMERVKKKGAAMMVYSSTGGQIYGQPETIPIKEDTPERPVSAYGVAKLAMEQLTRMASENGPPHLIVRLSNPYGPHQEKTNRHGAVAHLMKRALEGGTFTSYGDTVRDYLYIEDAAGAIADLMDSAAENVTVNVGSGSGTLLSGLIRMIEEVSGKRIKVRKEPQRPTDVLKNVLDVSRLRELTGSAPDTPLRHGLERTWRHMKDHAKK